MQDKSATSNRTHDETHLALPRRPLTAPPGKDDIINLLRGFCMGAADTVPGVSGGTVALVLGHYERLIAAISHVDRSALRLLSERRWMPLANHLDARFMLVLLAGVAAGIASLASLMHWLLENRYPQTMAVFFGLVLASGWVVGVRVRQWRLTSLGSFAFATVVAGWISLLNPAAGRLGLFYFFASGAVAICAMILPGISGAFILLLLGMYHTVTGMVRDVLHGQLSVDTLLRLGVFATGCLLGLLAFSRLLRWLLTRYYDTTLSALAGLMVGSLVKLWPLQLPTSETRNLEFKERVFELYSPTQWPIDDLLGLTALATFAAIFVLAGDVIGRRLES